MSKMDRKRMHDERCLMQVDFVSNEEIHWCQIQYSLNNSEKGIFTYYSDLVATAVRVYFLLKKVMGEKNCVAIPRARKMHP